MNDKQFITEYGDALIDKILSVNFYDLKETKDDVLTASEFTDPLKLMVLKRKFKKEIAELPPNNSENLASLHGSAVHEILERLDDDDPNILTEERLEINMKGIEVSGKFDRVDLNEKILQDYKSTNLWSHLFDLEGEKHKVQLSIYRYLFALNKDIVLRPLALVIRMIRDFSGTMKTTGAYCKKNEVTPPHRDMISIPVELMSLEETRVYVSSAVDEYKYAMSKTIDEVQEIQCTDEEMWRKVTGVRVIKETRQRCEKYCKVAPFCKQYQDWLKSNEN